MDNKFQDIVEASIRDLTFQKKNIQCQIAYLKKVVVNKYLYHTFVIFKDTDETPIGCLLTEKANLELAHLKHSEPEQIILYTREDDMLFDNLVLSEDIVIL